MGNLCKHQYEFARNWDRSTWNIWRLPESVTPLFIVVAGDIPPTAYRETFWVGKTPDGGLCYSYITIWTDPNRYAIHKTTIKELRDRLAIAKAKKSREILHWWSSQFEEFLNELEQEEKSAVVA